MGPFSMQQAIRIACFFIVLGGLSAAPNRVRPPSKFLQFTPPDQAEGKRILQEFRQRGLGNVFFRFELQFLPRRGEEKMRPGQLWLGRTPAGPAYRVELPASGGQPEARFLIHGGRNPLAWRWESGGALVGAPLGVADLFLPIGDTDLTVFDLQMPYLYWDDFVYEGLAKYKGRVAEVFLLYPPEGWSSARPELTGVRIYLDSQFYAMVKAESLGPDAAINSTLSVADFKKVDDHWVAKAIELRNEKTRHRSRLVMTAAAAVEDWPREVFAEGNLAGSVALPAEAQLRSLAP